MRRIVTVGALVSCFVFTLVYPGASPASAQSQGSYSGAKKIDTWKPNKVMHIKAWRGWRGCFGPGPCEQYRFVVHLKATRGRRNGHWKIVKHRAWTSISSSSGFEYHGLVGSHTERKWKETEICAGRVHKVTAMRKGHFSVFGRNFYPRVRINIYAGCGGYGMHWDHHTKG
jgi:hypothetical protein